MISKSLRLTTLLVAVASFAGAAGAQDRSTPDPAEQTQDRAALTAIFESQMESLRIARESPQLGASRGLVLAPIDPPRPAAATSDADDAPELTLNSQVSAEGRVPAAAPTTTHWILPDDQQVNVRVTFDFDSAAIAASETPKLRDLCAAMEQAGVGVFRIIGHTDATGDAAYNQRLSVQRAEEVRRFFMTDCGVPSERLEAVGVGKQFPVNAQDPFAGENRRVEFQALS